MLRVSMGGGNNSDSMQPSVPIKLNHNYNRLPNWSTGSYKIYRLTQALKYNVAPCNGIGIIAEGFTKTLYHLGVKIPLYNWNVAIVMSRLGDKRVRWPGSSGSNRLMHPSILAASFAICFDDFYFCSVSFSFVFSVNRRLYLNSCIDIIFIVLTFLY